MQMDKAKCIYCSGVIEYVYDITADRKGLPPQCPHCAKTFTILVSSGATVAELVRALKKNEFAMDIRVAT